MENALWSTASSVGSVEQRPRNDEVGLDERAQRGERVQRLHLVEQHDGLDAAGELLVPAGRRPCSSSVSDASEGFALFEEEVELEQIPQAVGLLPRTRRRGRRLADSAACTNASSAIEPPTKKCTMVLR